MNKDRKNLNEAIKENVLVYDLNQPIDKDLEQALVELKQAAFTANRNAPKRDVIYMGPECEKAMKDILRNKQKEKISTIVDQE